MKIKISVILPSLNVVQYIEECMESVVNQTLKEIEIICVDAGSTDGTLDVLRRYEACDSRVKVIVSDKKSYGKQMNLGIQAARGEYIGIVETDDYVPKEMYGELYEIASGNNVDFVKADFYRFSGEDKDLCKAINRLSKDSNYYNRIVNIEEEQECFQFPINTWSGIYSRLFLEKYDIRHNETQGASYQDNGFWFQTFMYAKRAYFVQKPYYMNRRDNPNSSVYSKNKVFCICDEYKYILEVLKKNALLHKFGDTYVKACYQAYRGHLNRVSEEFKEMFLKRFSEDFRELQFIGILQEGLFSINEWKCLNDMLNDSSIYYTKNRQLRKEVYDEIARYESVIIYGAGMVGKRLFQDLQAIGQTKNIVCFAVSEKAENLDKIEDANINNIADLVEHKNSLVVIATTAAYHETIKENLRKLGFEKIFPLPECVFM